MRSDSKTRAMVFTGMFSVLALILYLIEIPLFGNYLKIDLSDLPAALAGVMFGPFAAVAVEFIKNFFHLVIRGLGDTLGYGDLMNFLVGTALCVPFSIVMRRLFGRRTLAVSSALAGAAGLVSMVAVGVAGNYLLAPPYFQWAMHFRLTGGQLWAAIGMATLLNVIKPVVVTVLAAPVLAAGKKYFTPPAKS